MQDFSFEFLIKECYHAVGTKTRKMETLVEPKETIDDLIKQAAQEIQK